MNRKKSIWLVGHGGFYNRGCEAIVRTTLELLSETLGPCRFLLRSLDPDRDRAALANSDIQVVSALDWYYPKHSRLRWRFALRKRRLDAHGWLDRWLQSWAALPDCVLSVGGDNFTLDYGPPHNFVREGEFFLQHHIPFVIWGASIGSFAADPEWEQRMKSFLPRVSLITVRESVTLEYLQSLGVTRNAVRVWDPAFALQSQPCLWEGASFLDGGKVVGLNLSALIANWFPGRDREGLLAEARQFVAALLAQGYRVLLVPHVTQPGMSLEQNDEAFLRLLQGSMPTAQTKLALLPGSLPAPQIKGVLARCHLFIGARTHATIGAVSSGVPTLAIAYSAKARGIWRDIFGHEDFLLETPRFRAPALLEKFTQLNRQASEVRAKLERMRPVMLAGAKANAQALQRLLFPTTP